jgi:tripartite-type tricarboxylate transporter receptor subunit TctC
MRGRLFGTNSTRLSRRCLLELAAGAAGLPGIARIGMAQGYPTQPVRIIVGAPAGGLSDILARLLGKWLTEHLGQQFIVENRAGAATNIATELVVCAARWSYAPRLHRIGRNQCYAL